MWDSNPIMKIISSKLINLSIILIFLNSPEHFLDILFDFEHFQESELFEVLKIENFHI